MKSVPRVDERCYTLQYTSCELAEPFALDQGSLFHLVKTLQIGSI